LAATVAVGSGLNEELRNEGPPSMKKLLAILLLILLGIGLGVGIATLRLQSATWDPTGDQDVADAAKTTDTR
jgi:hypothetical protein